MADENFNLFIGAQSVKLLPSDMVSWLSNLFDIFKSSMMQYMMNYLLLILF
jgi:hypothetical protein